MKTDTSVRGTTKSDPKEKEFFGLMAEFADHQKLVTAARSAYRNGYRRMDAYSPFPVDGLSEALGHDPSVVPLFTLLGGMTGGIGGYLLQWYVMAHLYALNVGGRPFNSWPNYIPITFEMTILAAAFSALITMLIVNRLPELNHPVFNVPEFRRASIDRFFLCIEAGDPLFDSGRTREFLLEQQPAAISEVTL